MIFSSEGRIATDIRASPSLAPLVGDMNARGSRRLRVGVDLLPGDMVIRSRRRGSLDDGSPTVTLPSAEIRSIEVVWLIIGSGLAVTLRDATAFAVCLPTSGAMLRRKVSRWRDTPASRPSA